MGRITDVNGAAARRLSTVEETPVYRLANDTAPSSSCCYDCTGTVSRLGSRAAALRVRGKTDLVTVPDRSCG
jgi:hypothetical protein